MTQDDLIKKINNCGILNFGDVIIFGSFVNNNGENYRDIDLLVNSDSSNTLEIEKLLADAGFSGKCGPVYYSTNIPTFNPPNGDDDGKDDNSDDEEKSSSDQLHVIVGSMEEVQDQPFYSTIAKKSFIKLSKVA